MSAFGQRPVPERLERVVSATPAEFARALKAAARPLQPQAIAGGWRLHDGVLQLDIVVCARPPRRLGSFCLPQLQARYLFAGADEAARHALLARLDRGMQRGGG